MIADPYGRPSPPAPPVYVREAAPVGDVVDIARLRRHLRLDETDVDDVENELIAGSLAAVVAELDGHRGMLRRALLLQTWSAASARPAPDAVDGHAGFRLELPPVRDVLKVQRRVGGQYQDLPAEAWQRVDLRDEQAAVIPADGLSWPEADLHPAAWRVTFRAGYASAGDVPAAICAAILLMVADLYDNRDGKTQANLIENPTVGRLLRPFGFIGA